MMKTPESAADLWSFIKPFDSHVWMCIFLSLLLVAGVLSVLTRISNHIFKKTYENYEKSTKKLGYQQLSENDTSCVDSTYGDKESTLFGVMWFAYSALMQQGVELRGYQSVSVKIVIGIWWFFALIVLSSYTANLAAFLTVTRMDSPIGNFDDLANQDKIQYGTVMDTSIMDFIRDKARSQQSPNDKYHRLYMMINKESNQIRSLQEGLDRVKSSNSKSNFAFLWDVAVIQHEIIRDENCSLTSTPDSISGKGYGIALRQGSDHTEFFSLGILRAVFTINLENWRYD